MAKPIIYVEDSSVFQLISLSQKALSKMRRTAMASRLIEEAMKKSNKKEIEATIGKYVIVKNIRNIDDSNPFSGLIDTDDDDGDDGNDGDILH
jgi:hypothetical protein